MRDSSLLHVEALPLKASTWPQRGLNMTREWSLTTRDSSLLHVEALPLRASTRPQHDKEIVADCAGLEPTA